MGKRNSVKIIVHDRRVEIKISGREATVLPAFAEQLVSEQRSGAMSATASPTTRRHPAPARGRAFLAAIKGLFDALRIALIDKGTAIVLRIAKKLVT